MPTLGDVLYANQSSTTVVEQEWEALVRAIGQGDQTALHALYERSHRLVFTLAMRITRSRETAEELTVDVFHDVWRRASGYDPANGSVLGWIMNQARSRSLDRLRYDNRKKRVDPHPQARTEEAGNDSADRLESAQRNETLVRALVVLSPDERSAIEAAFFNELTHSEVAEKLQEPLGTIKTRIRSGLQKLRIALGAEMAKP